MNINITRTVDKYAGKIICKTISILPKSKTINLQTLQKIIIIKLWAVGESVLTLPLIKSIKQTYPQAQITVLARNRNKDIYTGQPFIDDVILFEQNNITHIIKQFKKFDLAIDCEPYLNISAILGKWLAKKQIGYSHGTRAKLYSKTIEYNDKQHAIKTYLDLAKIISAKTNNEKLIKLNYAEEDKNQIETLLKQNDINKKDALVGICASVAESSKDRMWASENYAQIIDGLIQKYGAKILLVGGKNDYWHNESIIKLCKNNEKILNFAGKTSLKGLFALMVYFKLFISNDTGPMHIAAAQGVQTIGIFGPNTPIRFAPCGKKNISLYVQQDCSPCINVHKAQFPECVNPIKGKCTKEITPKMVMEAVKKCLK